MSLHQPTNATRMIPLAPPAEENPPNLKSNLQNLASWLSPRVTRPSTSHARKQQRSESNTDDSDDNDRSKKRGHHQILMRPRGSSLDRKQADGRGGTTSCTASNNTISAGDLHRTWKTEDRDLMSQSISRSTDGSFEDDPVASSGGGGGYRYSPQHRQQHQVQRKSSGTGSLLTTFLLYFDALLPEYFTYFPSASDIENNGAANAVSVLERGARMVQLHAVSPVFKRHSQGGSGDRQPDPTRSSASSNPSHVLPEPPFSNSSTNDTNRNMNQQHRQQLLTREKLQRVAGQVSPRRKRFNSTLQAEWERFTSPFLMLAGAEVLYGEMEHVLDPETERRFANGESLFFGSSGEDGKAATSSSTAVQFDSCKEQTDPSSAHSPTPSTGDSSNKRGSRRLIAMYRQVREDFIIVGEYLCDPVLGCGGGSVNSTPQSTPSPRSSPNKAYGRSQSQPMTLENIRKLQLSPSGNLNQEATSSDESQRQIAARSLRNTLNALIVFIDARCVLVKIHADLCCWQHVQLSTLEGGIRGGNKWAMLADQCRSLLLKISFLACNKDSMVQLALSKLETETKALELALLSVYHMMECE